VRSTTGATRDIGSSFHDLRLSVKDLTVSTLVAYAIIPTSSLSVLLRERKDAKRGWCVQGRTWGTGRKYTPAISTIRAYSLAWLGRVSNSLPGFPTLPSFRQRPGLFCDLINPGLRRKRLLGSPGCEAVRTIIIHDPRPGAHGMATNHGIRDCMHTDVGVMFLSPFKQPC